MPNSNNSQDLDEGDKPGDQGAFPKVALLPLPEKMDVIPTKSTTISASTERSSSAISALTQLATEYQPLPPKNFQAHSLLTPAATQPATRSTYSCYARQGVSPASPRATRSATQSATQRGIGRSPP
jgi:hypothetical protein